VGAGARGLIVYRFGADLFYANVNRFTDEVRALAERAPTPVHWFIVDAGPITHRLLRHTRSARRFGAGVGMVFAGVSPYLRPDMDRHGITQRLGKRRFSRR
jgi:MFS superfamily sulfate permease-like transporter